MAPAVSGFMNRNCPMLMRSRKIRRQCRTHASGVLRLERQRCRSHEGIDPVPENRDGKKAECNHIRPSTTNQELGNYPTLVPHSSQNLAPGFSSFWQFEHFAGSCDVPQSLQNFAPA